MSVPVKNSTKTSTLSPARIEGAYALCFDNEITKFGDARHIERDHILLALVEVNDEILVPGRQACCRIVFENEGVLAAACISRHELCIAPHYIFTVPLEAPDLALGSGNQDVIARLELQPDTVIPLP